MIQRDRLVMICDHPSNAALAGLAAAEVASREKHYPGMIERGEIARDEADVDLLAWRCLADLFGQRECNSIPFENLITAAEAACASREQACARKPASAALRNRRDRVRWMREHLLWLQIRRRDPPAPVPELAAA